MAEMKMRVFKNFDIAAPSEMVEAVQPGDALQTTKGMVCLEDLPDSFNAPVDGLKMVHLLWLKKKHPSIVMAYNRKTREVSIDLGGG